LDVTIALVALVATLLTYLELGLTAEDFAMLTKEDRTAFYKAAGQTKDGVRDQGFPPKITEAFLKTANARNAVVATRVPGKATTTLIGERYDLKGYQIKAKSCNWGPMSGFLCKNPAFNKKGGRDDQPKNNAEANVKYIKTLKTKFSKTAADAFTDLKISDARKQEFMGSLPQDELIETSPDRVCGIAMDKDKVEEATVVMEFLIVKEQELWSLFQGKVFIRDDPKNSFTEYKIPADLSDLSPLKSRTDTSDALLVFGADELAQLKTLLKQAGTPERGDNSATYVIEGIQNPYPPYTDTAKQYRNAVSGDYDLFAVWPVVPATGFDLLPRLTEIEITYREPDPIAVKWRNLLQKKRVRLREKEQRLFQSVAGKRFSLELKKSAYVYIEIIPPYDEIEKYESPYYGNINEAVYETALTLSSLVALQYAGQKEAPNVAFHSDEGGRPGLDEVDYPFAVFLPNELARELASDLVKGKMMQPQGKLPENNKIFLIDSHDEFLTLIKFLQGRCYITLNSAWAFAWFADLSATPPPQWEAKLKGLIFGSLPEKDVDPAYKQVKTAFAQGAALIQKNSVDDAINVRNQLAALTITVPG